MDSDSYSTKLALFSCAGYVNKRKTAIRYANVAVSAAFLFWATGAVLFLVWGLTYLVVTACFSKSLERGNSLVRAHHYWTAVALYNISVLVLASAPLYLITQSEPGLVFVGVLLLAMLMTYSLARRKLVMAALISDCGQMFFVVITALVLLLPKVEPWPLKLFAGFITMGLMAYFCVCATTLYRRANLMRTAEAQLMQAQKNRLLGQFAGGIAHDFNNLLTAIRGNLDLAQAMPTIQDREQAIDDARHATERAAQTVRDLLACSERSRLTPTKVSLTSLLHAFRAELQSKFGTSVSLEILPLDTDAAVFADPAVLKDSLFKLCENAIEAMPEGGHITVTVDTQPDHAMLVPAPTSPPPHLAIRLRDTGRAVPPDSLPLLAEPFYTTKPVGKGLGLSLAAVAGFARQSGGGLHFDLPPNGGLRASLILPSAKKA